MNIVAQPTFFPELVALAFVFWQLFSLVSGPKNFLYKMFYPLVTMNFIFSLLLSILFFKYPEELLFAGLIKSSLLFRPVRMVIYFSGMVLVGQILYSSVIPEKRKRELVFILSLTTFFASVLILSINLFVSFLCLLGLATAGLFMAGAPFRGRLEGEAIYKFWYQYSLIIIIGFFSLTILSYIAGGLEYDVLRKFYESSATHNLFIFWISLGLAPMFLLAGVFPMHFTIIDRDHGIAWPIQATETVLISGVSMMALFKAAVHFFYEDKNMGSSRILNLLMVLGFIGLLWSIMGALTQKSTKRFMAFLSSSLWSICLITIAIPSALSLASSVYYFVCASIALLLIFAGITRIHERIGEEESWDALVGTGTRFPQYARLVLLGLLCFLFLPPSFGFSALLNLLGAMFEQKSLLLVCVTCFGVFFIFMAALRMLSAIYFEDIKYDFVSNSSTTGGISFVDRLLFFIGVLIVFGFGIWGDIFFQSLLESAKVFIIS